MTTKEFSKLFGMTTCEMAEFLGMSRQGLNEIVQGRSAKPSKKKHDAMIDLKALAAQKYFEEEKEVTERYMARLNAADIFDVN